MSLRGLIPLAAAILAGCSSGAATSPPLNISQSASVHVAAPRVGTASVAATSIAGKAKLNRWSAQTVVATSSPFASVLLVVGHTYPYFFQPGAVPTRTSGRLIVRSFGHVFVFKESNIVQKRRLDQATNSNLSDDSIATETNSTLIATINSEAGSGGAPTCPDCDIPVAESNAQPDVVSGIVTGYLWAQGANQTTLYFLSPYGSPYQYEPDAWSSDFMDDDGGWATQSGFATFIADSVYCLNVFGLQSSNPYLNNPDSFMDITIVFPSYTYYGEAYGYGSGAEPGGPVC